MNRKLQRGNIKGKGDSGLTNQIGILLKISQGETHPGIVEEEESDQISSIEDSCSTAVAQLFAKSRF